MHEQTAQRSIPLTFRWSRVESNEGNRIIRIFKHDRMNLRALHVEAENQMVPLDLFIQNAVTSSILPL